MSRLQSGDALLERNTFGYVHGVTAISVAVFPSTLRSPSLVFFPESS